MAASADSGTSRAFTGEIGNEETAQCSADGLPHESNGLPTREHVEKRDNLLPHRFVSVLIFWMRGLPGLLKVRTLTDQLSPFDVDLSHQFIQEPGILDQHFKELTQRIQGRLQVPAGVRLIGGDQSLQDGLQHARRISHVSVDEQVDFGSSLYQLGDERFALQERASFTRDSFGQRKLSPRKHVLRDPAIAVILMLWSHRCAVEPPCAIPLADLIAGTQPERHAGDGRHASVERWSLTTLEDP